MGLIQMLPNYILANLLTKPSVFYYSANCILLSSRKILLLYCYYNTRSISSLDCACICPDSWMLQCWIHSASRMLQCWIHPASSMLLCWLHPVSCMLQYWVRPVSCMLQCWVRPASYILLCWMLDSSCTLHIVMLNSFCSCMWRCEND